MRVSLVITALAACVFTACTSYNSPTGAPGSAGRHYPYNRPLTSLGGKFSTMPLAAQRTVLAQAGAAEIVDVVKESTAERVYFKVYFRDAVDFPTLYVAPDGSVLNPDLTVAVPALQDGTSACLGDQLGTVSVNELPAAVAKTVAERAPNAQIATVSKEIWGNHVVYVISFQDEARHPKLYVMGEGASLHPVSK